MSLVAVIKVEPTIFGERDGLELFMDDWARWGADLEENIEELFFTKNAFREKHPFSLFPKYKITRISGNSATSFQGLWKPKYITLDIHQEENFIFIGINCDIPDPRDNEEE